MFLVEFRFAPAELLWRSWSTDFVYAAHFLVIKCFAKDDQFIDAAVEVANARPMPPVGNTPIADGGIADFQLIVRVLLQRLTRCGTPVDIVRHTSLVGVVSGRQMHPFPEPKRIEDRVRLIVVPNVLGVPHAENEIAIPANLPMKSVFAGAVCQQE